jgi:hypothetical protein
MKHPCSKKCISYATCLNNPKIRCSILRDYYEYLFGCNMIKSNLSDKIHDKVWKELHKNLPNLERVYPMKDTKNE